MALTVKELIEELSKYPEYSDKVPVVYGPASHEYYPDSVEIDVDNNDLIVNIDTWVVE